MKKSLLIICCFLSNLIFSQESDFVYYISGNSPKFGILNEKGKTIVPNQYETIDQLSDGLFALQLNGKYGFINTKGELVIPFQFDSTRGFTDGYAIVITDNDFGVIDKKGNIVLKMEYDGIYPTGLKQTFLIFDRKRNKYVANIKGEKIFEIKYDSFDKFYNDYAVIKNDNKYGLIDKNGNIVIACKYYALGNYENGFSLTFKKEKEDLDGLMDLHENILVEPKYDFLSTGLVDFIAINSLKGLMDKSGKIVLTPEYDQLGYSFEEGLISISKDGKYGFANEKGEIVISMIYDEVKIFSAGIAPALKKGFWGFIDKNGNTVIDFKFKGEMRSFSNGYAEYGKGESSSETNSVKWGFIDKKGNVIIPNKYKSVNGYKKGLFSVETSKENILINLKGNTVAKLNDTDNGKVIGSAN